MGATPLFIPASTIGSSNAHVPSVVDCNELINKYTRKFGECRDYINIIKNLMRDIVILNQKGIPRLSSIHV